MNEYEDNKDQASNQGDTSEDQKVADHLEQDPNDQPSDTESVTKGQAEPKESPGTILKRKREAQGISLDVVHDATKVPMDVLRAIEEGYTIRTLSPFYYKGFLKMYANYLGVDASEVIEDYKEEELPEHIDQDMEDFQIPQWIPNFFTRERKRQIVIVALSILALFLIIKIVGLIGSLITRPPEKKNVNQKQTVTGTATKKAPVKKIAAKKEVKKVVKKKPSQARQEPPKIDVPKEIPKVESKVEPKIEPKVKQPAQPAPKPQRPVVTPIAAIQKDIVLTVRAKQNSWLRVRSDGTIVFQSTLRLGAVETWMADDEIEISGKNIDQLEFELNGKMIGTLGRKDRNANKVVITKNGLSVKD